MLLFTSNSNLPAQGTPVYVSTANNYGTTRDVVTSGDYAYTASYDGRLQIYNISNRRARNSAVSLVEQKAFRQPNRKKSQLGR
ncbi:hypothetical protein [Pedosphaera parvula]|uniref:Uncharacterized protein n=1 Tax=Pedosphaera parvula (strain Ellin514) TaxID=320771 RepID=B9XDW7_PEDPL|nr:hypothetical protein [Pedosphaera parvula]EEF61858.1 hypothetical protein Cflav_PD4521 [Pedosphaera parvula Ellin514]